MPDESGTITVFVADDHPLFREGVAGLLAGAGDVTVVGQAGSGADALRAILASKPRIAVVDIAMPELNGVALVERLGTMGCPTRVAVLSVHEERVYVEQALAAGARGYLLKRSTGENLLHAVRAMAAGGLYLDPAVAGRHIASPPRKDAGPRDLVRSTGALTQREEEVVRLVALGYTSKEVAGRLGIAAKSVESHKARAAEKLGIGSRAKLVQYALIKGWLNGHAH